MRWERVIPWVWRTRIIRFVAGGLYLALGVVCAVFSLRNGDIAPLIPACALGIWGYAFITGPAPVDRLRRVDWMSPLLLIPLAPFYVNWGAEALWEEDWASLGTRLHLLILAGTALLVVPVALLALNLRRQEVRSYRTRVFQAALYSAPPRSAEVPTVPPVGLAERWARVPLSVDRCKRLIAAGISVEHATSQDVVVLTHEQLAAIAYLAHSPALRREAF